MDGDTNSESSSQDKELCKEKTSDIDINFPERRNVNESLNLNSDVLESDIKSDGETVQGATISSEHNNEVVTAVHSFDFDTKGIHSESIFNNSDDIMSEVIIGVKGDEMLVNTDSAEECRYLDAQAGPEYDQLLIQKTNMSEVSNQSSDSLNETFSDAESTISASQITQVEVTEEDEEYYQNKHWLNKEKHIFILSESGKPIYTRYGKEDRLVAMFGLMQALVSFVADSDDTIRCINAGGHKYVFLIRSPLILVCVSHSTASLAQLLMQLTYVHSQIVSVLTAPALTRMFEKRRNYDFRNLLGGSERLLDSLLNFLDCHPSFLLGAIQCLPLNTSVRDSITQSIVQSCAKIKKLVFGLIIAENQLISLVRMKKYLLHPADLHLIFNLVSATASLKTSENWMPICLPKFDSKGYLYGHVSYLSENCEACLILLSVDKEHFFTLSEAKDKIVERFKKLNCLEKITSALKISLYSSKVISSPELRHFLYKSKSTAQYTCPVFEAPYNNEESQRRLYGLYQQLHHRIHSVSRPLRMMYFLADVEIVIGWVTKEFELYASLEPFSSKENTVITVNKLVQWIKAEENKLFILNSPTF